MQSLSLLLVTTIVNFQPAAPTGEPPAGDPLTRITVRSSQDGAEQVCRIWTPAGTEKRPLLVFLHSWSGDVSQDNSHWHRLAMERDWMFLQPDFRGTNTRPEACGSPLAQQDILDAIQWTVERHPVDTDRIYLAGTSGGGHMALLMAANHPERFSAVSAWASITDLKAWWEFTRQDSRFVRYARNIEAVAGGAPGTQTIDADLERRSSAGRLANAAELPLDINAGIHDGKTGSVPWSHSVIGFNAILKAHGEPVLDPEAIPFDLPQDDAVDGRAIHFRKTSGKARLTIFEGGHEDLPQAGMAYFDAQRRATMWNAAGDKPRP